MKKFVMKLSLWLFPIVLILIVIGTLNYYKEKLKLQERIEIISKYDNFIFGDSEIGQLNRFNFYNATQGGENYEWILQKVKLIRQAKKAKFDTIFLGISPRLFFTIQEIVSANENKRKASLANLFFENESSLVGIHALIFNSALSFGDGKGATIAQTGIIDSKKITRNCHFRDSNLTVEIDKNLVSLIKFCIRNCRYLVIIRSPVSRGHLLSTPRKFKDRYIDEINHGKLLGARYLDFTMENWSDLYFFDQNHLNYLGSKRFNSKINNLLN